jgi:hypothetical protein
MSPKKSNFFLAAKNKDPMQDFSKLKQQISRWQGPGLLLLLNSQLP